MYKKIIISCLILFFFVFSIKKENITEDVFEIETIPRDVTSFKDKKLIALTFDDGPSKNTNKLLSSLDKYNARVTFFVLGSRVIQFKDILKLAYDMGNTIGSHTYNHKNLLSLKAEKIESEIKLTNNVIENIIGISPCYLRPPYGNTNNKIKNDSNMYTILWDVDPEDWKYRNSDKIAEKIIEGAHDGAIVLLHDIYSESIEGALIAMDKLTKEGYAFVSIDEMINLKQKKLEIIKTYYSF